MVVVVVVVADAAAPVENKQTITACIYYDNTISTTSTEIPQTITDIYAYCIYTPHEFVHILLISRVHKV